MMLVETYGLVPAPCGCILKNTVYFPTPDQDFLIISLLQRSPSLRCKVAALNPDAVSPDFLDVSPGVPGNLL